MQDISILKCDFTTITIEQLPGDQDRDDDLKDVRVSDDDDDRTMTTMILASCLSVV